MLAFHWQIGQGLYSQNIVRRFTLCSGGRDRDCASNANRHRRRLDATTSCFIMLRCHIWNIAYDGMYTRRLGNNFQRYVGVKNTIACLFVIRRCRAGCTADCRHSRRREDWASRSRARRVCDGYNSSLSASASWLVVGECCARGAIDFGRLGCRIGWVGVSARCYIRVLLIRLCTRARPRV